MEGKNRYVVPSTVPVATPVDMCSGVASVGAHTRTLKGHPDKLPGGPAPWKLPAHLLR